MKHAHSIYLANLEASVIGNTDFAWSESYWLLNCTCTLIMLIATDLALECTQSLNKCASHLSDCFICSFTKTCTHADGYLHCNMGAQTQV